MFKILKVSGLGPMSELSGAQPGADISISGADTGNPVGAMPAAQMDPRTPVPEPPPQTDPGFGRLSVQQACTAIDERAKRLSILKHAGLTRAGKW